MKYGIRECCDVVFRALAPQKIGKKTFFTNEPVIYFDSLKTSSLEGAATTVYAQGGRGNARLMAWEGERTLTFTMEDALIAPEGIAILTGAGLIEAETGKPIKVHCTRDYVIKETDSSKVTLTGKKLKIEGLSINLGTVSNKPGYYVMLKNPQGDIICEPFSSDTHVTEGKVTYTGSGTSSTLSIAESTDIDALDGVTSLTGYSLFIDYYQDKESGARQIDIEPGKFGGYFYVEASTLFRDFATGKDYPAEFIIPKAKVQSNFTFTMAGSGDPSSFTFTLDAFPGRIYGGSKDVLAAIQIIDEVEVDGDVIEDPRTKTIYS